MEYWLPYFSTPQDLIKLPISKHTLLTKQLHLCNSFNISFFPHVDTTIGHISPIYHHLSPIQPTLTSWRKRRLMFKDQLTFIDGNFLLTWEEYNAKPSTPLKTRKPKWFDELEESSILSPHTRRLVTPLPAPPITTLSYSHLKVGASKQYFRPKNEWSMVWSSIDKDVTYGKTIEQVNDPLPNISITYREHFIPTTSQYDRITTTHHANDLVYLSVARVVPYYRDHDMC